MPSRRDYLRGLASAGFVGFAGCFDDEPVAGRWPRAGYDDRNTSDVTDRDGPGAVLSQAWTADVPQGTNHASPVLADGRLYVGYETPRSTESAGRVGVRILDAGTGETVRDRTVTTHEDGGSATLFRDSVAVAGESLYLLAFDGVHSYDLDGERRWHRPVAGSPNRTIQRGGHPVVVDGVVYAPTASITASTDAREGVLAIDDDSGDLLWRYDVPEGAEFGWTFSTAFADRSVYVSMLEEGVVALDADSGEVDWRTELPVDGPPTVADGRLFVTGDPGGEANESFIAALDLADGEEAWRRTDEGERLDRGIAAANGGIYCRERLDTLVCRDAATGEERWRFTDADGVSLGRPVVTSDALYVGISRRNDDGGVVALDPDSGARLGTTGLEKNAGPRVRIAASDDRLFVNTARGRVYALERCRVDVGERCLV